MPIARLECRTLGPPELLLDGSPAPAVLAWRRHLALLVYLARSPGRVRSREHLTGLLWPEKPARAARHSLNEAVRALRSHLGDAVESSLAEVRLTAHAIRLDVDRLDALTTDGEWAAAAALVGGEFLEGLAISAAPELEHWIEAERTAWRLRSVEVLIAHATRLLEQGYATRSAEAAARALTLEPLCEPAARAVMSAFAVAGERAEALRRFDEIRRRLAEGVGAEPSADTRALAERIRCSTAAREPATKAPAPDDPAVRARRTPLVGRAAEIEALSRVTEPPGCPELWVVSGPPGVGRSRLLEEVVTRAALRGAAVVRFRAVEGDAPERWSGARGLVRALAGVPGVSAAAPDAVAACVDASDEWRARFGRREGAPMGLGTALGEVLRAAGAEQHTVLALDDGQWLDAESVGALEQFVRDGGGQVTVVITVVEPNDNRRLDAWRSRLGRETPGRELRLEPLDAAAIGDLVVACLPYAPEPQRGRLARRVLADSAGLPLLAVELLHAVSLGLDLGRAGSAWPATDRTLDHTLPTPTPETVVAAIRIGYRRLSAAAQKVLAVASLAAEPVDADRLIRGTDLPPHALEAALDELEWGRWLQSDARGYGFVARVVRAVVSRDMLLPGQRRRLLQRLEPPSIA